MGYPDKEAAPSKPLFSSSETSILRFFTARL
jgi:hypothetical protein